MLDKRTLPDGFFELWERLEGVELDEEFREAYEAARRARIERVEFEWAENESRIQLNRLLAGGWKGVLRGDPCAYCGARCEDLDHIDARSRGGDNTWQNLTASCRVCNGQKGARTLLSFLGGRRLHAAIDPLEVHRRWAQVAR